MKRYFKRDGETQLGNGTFYLEFEDEIPLRQVEVYGDRYFSSRDDYHEELGPGLGDRYLSELGMTADHEISAEEFERVWIESGKGR